MSEQLFSFEGRFITLAQINMIKENRVREAEIANEPKTKKMTAKEALKASKVVATPVEETVAEDIDPTTLSEDEVIVVPDPTTTEPVVEKTKAEKKAEAKAAKAAAKKSKK